MSTASNLAHLLAIKSDINYYTQQEIWYSNKLEATSAKLGKYTKYEEKWEDAYDSAMYNDKALKINGVEVVAEGNTSEAVAQQYADNKVQERDEEIYLELVDLDNEYDAIKTMYDTMLEELRADEETAKNATSQDAQQTHLLGS
jgi:hypothetical protein